MASSYPFVYVNHGSYLLESMGKGADAYIGFTRAPTRAELVDIERGVPLPLRGDPQCTGKLFATSSGGDTFDWLMVEHYATKAEQAESQKSHRADFGQKTADRFAADVEAWVQGVHTRVPVAFFIGPCAAGIDDPWDEWSRAHLAEVMVPLLEELIAATPRFPADRVPDGSVGKLTADAVACSLQNLDEDQGVAIPAALARRVAKLKKKFPV